MNALNVTVRYRPLRIGWCVRQNDFEALRRSWLLSHTMWGGRYNPIIPVDDVEYARSLVDLFRVDILWSVATDETIESFIKSFPYLPDQFFNTPFISKGKEKKAVILDITHPIRHLYNEHFKNIPHPDLEVVLYDWKRDDPLADVWLTTFGAVPSREVTGTDYLGRIEEYLPVKRITITPDDPWPVGTENQMTLSDLARYGIQQHYSMGNHSERAGFYYGSAGDFDDLINYWNLQATDRQVIFFDPAHNTRFADIKTELLIKLESSPRKQFDFDNFTMIWSKTDFEHPDSHFSEGKYCHSVVNRSTWNGLNIKTPYVYFSENQTMAMIVSGSAQPQVIFQLLSKPYSDDWQNHDQHLVISINFGMGLFGDERSTLVIPDISELNVYYGNQCLLEWFGARSEPDGLGVISAIWAQNMSIRALDIINLIAKIFEFVGISAAPSKPGLIATRLIRQMGALQDCRPFKIPGVRKLIEDHDPGKSFTRSNAVQTVRAVDPKTNNIGFSLFEDLYIERRPVNRKLTPDSVLDYLMKKGVFRAGMEFDCPSCKLKFWISIDEISTEIKCEYCGNQFNITPCLRHRGDWRFRRTGLFGRSDNQEGAIPVVLTLQQFDTVFRLREMLYATAMELKSGKCKIRDCETDFIVVIPKHHSGRIQVAIGECKNRGSITEDDVDKLSEIAGAFPSGRFDVFIVFAKLLKFTPNELKYASRLNDKYNHRVILLTDRELEPYYLFERTSKEFTIDKSVNSFEDMANITHQIYFRS
jgi:DNA-directed RNA polymerase subunit RPC12/RpoP